MNLKIEDCIRLLDSINQARMPSQSELNLKDKILNYLSAIVDPQGRSQCVPVVKFGDPNVPMPDYMYWPLDCNQVGAVSAAVEYLKEVRTGTDFETECWSAADQLIKVFNLKNA